MTDWAKCPAVESRPGKLAGAWVFRGTRVPVSALFENLEDGALLSQFVVKAPYYVTMDIAGFVRGRLSLSSGSVASGQGRDRTGV